MVVVAFASFGDMKILLEELSREPSPPRQWIGSESWVTSTELTRFTFCAGAIGFGIPKSVIPGFRDFLLNLFLSSCCFPSVYRVLGGCIQLYTEQK